MTSERSSVRALCRSAESEPKDNRAEASHLRRRRPQPMTRDGFLRKVDHGDASTRLGMLTGDRSHARGCHRHRSQLPHYPMDLNLTGIDLSPEMLDMARARAQQYGSGSGVARGDAQDLPFPGQLIRHGGVHLRAVQRSRRCPGGQRDEDVSSNPVAVSSWWTMCDPHSCPSFGSSGCTSSSRDGPRAST